MIRIVVADTVFDLGEYTIYGDGQEAAVFVDVAKPAGAGADSITEGDWGLVREHAQVSKKKIIFTETVAGCLLVDEVVDDVWVVCQLLFKACAEEVLRPR